MEETLTIEQGEETPDSSLDEQVEVDMLAEQCEDLFSRLTTAIAMAEQEERVMLQAEQVASKEHLQREYMQLCVQIERQEKELENFKFKMKVAHKEADYYSRQITEKEQILANLENHHANNAQHPTGKRSSTKK